MSEEATRDDGQRSEEPGLEDKGIGPAGLVIGGLMEGPPGVVAAWVGEKLIDIPGEISEYGKDYQREWRANSDANMAGFEQGLSDGMNQSSTAAREYSNSSRTTYETPASSFSRGYSQGARDAEEIRVGQAGAADGLADAARQQSSAPPAEYVGNPTYEAAYNAAQETDQGDGVEPAAPPS